MWPPACTNLLPSGSPYSPVRAVVTKPWFLYEKKHLWRGAWTSSGHGSHVYVAWLCCPLGSDKHVLLYFDVGIKNFKRRFCLSLERYHVFKYKYDDRSVASRTELSPTLWEMFVLQRWSNFWVTLIAKRNPCLFLCCIKRASFPIRVVKREVRQTGRGLTEAVQSFCVPRWPPPPSGHVAFPRHDLDSCVVQVFMNLHPWHSDTLWLVLHIRLWKLFISGLLYNLIKRKVGQKSTALKFELKNN